MIRQFVDSPTGPGGVAIAGSGADFDDIIGAHAPVAVLEDAVAPFAAPEPIAHPTASARPTPERRRRGRAPALAAVASLAVAGIVIAGALVASADLVAHKTLDDTAAVLASDSATAEKVVTTPDLAFGSVSSLGDDLAVSISDPIAYSPSTRATGAGNGVDVVSTVTITNTGSGPTDARLDVVPMGTTATRIFDRTQGIRIVSIPSLGVGQSITYRLAYAVGDVAKLSLRVTGASGDSIVYGS